MSLYLPWNLDILCVTPRVIMDPDALPPWTVMLVKSDFSFTLTLPVCIGFALVLSLLPSHTYHAVLTWNVDFTNYPFSRGINDTHELMSKCTIKALNIPSCHLVVS